MRAVHLSRANRIGKHVTADIFDWLRSGFEEAGYLVTESDNDLRVDTPNIILEHDNRGLKKVLDANRGKLRLVCFVTEIIGEDGAFIDPAGKARYENFLSIADHYSGFITTVPSNLTKLQSIAPTTLFEFGFTEKLMKVGNPAEWRHWFSFTGSLTDFRQQFLRGAGDVLDIYVPGLPGMNHPGRTSWPLPADAYLRIVRETAINICLKQSADWPLPSPTRLARIGHFGVGCAMQRTEIQTRQSALFPQFDTVEELMIMGSIPREEIARDAMDRLHLYRTTLPLNSEILRNLDECAALRC